MLKLSGHFKEDAELTNWHYVHITTTTTASNTNTTLTVTTTTTTTKATTTISGCTDLVALHWNFQQTLRRILNNMLIQVIKRV